jgi:hypothetical protein
VQNHAAVAVPFDEGVVFIGLLDCSTVAGRLSEVAQGLHTISGTKFLAGGRGLGKRRSFGTIGVWGCTWVRQRRLRGAGKSDHRSIAVMSHKGYSFWLARNRP